MKGFSLIELLIALAIISILVGFSIYWGIEYSKEAVKIQTLSDIRNCLDLIAISRQTGKDKTLEEIMRECPKSSYTEEIILESENPIVLKARARALLGEVECSYNEQIGTVQCSVN